MKRWYQIPYKDQVRYLIGACGIMVFLIVAMGMAA